jgi:hypothetical protein
MPPNKLMPKGKDKISKIFSGLPGISQVGGGDVGIARPAELCTFKASCVAADMIAARQPAVLCCD